MPTPEHRRVPAPRARASRLRVIPAAAVVIAMGATATVTARAQDGKAIFQSHCAACHSLGSNRVVGPGLQGVAALRTRAWLLRWIAAPDKVLASGDSVARRLLAEYNNLAMPNLSLSPAEVEAVVTFLEQVSGPSAPGAAQASAPPPPPPPPSPSTPPATSGSALVGKGLFTGAVRLRNGGPPCMACHSVAGIGALGGGALGPDLTGAASKYGANGLASILATTPFPTMRPVFQNRPLTPAEQADLLAFLQQTVATRPTPSLWRLAILGLLGAVVLLVPMQLVWRNRLSGVRRPLVERARRAPRNAGS